MHLNMSTVAFRPPITDVYEFTYKFATEFCFLTNLQVATGMGRPQAALIAQTIYFRKNT
jgi:hypothetical protein